MSLDSRGRGGARRVAQVLRQLEQSIDLNRQGEVLSDFVGPAARGTIENKDLLHLSTVAQSVLVAS